jgi:hypothetical protein
MEWLGGCFEKRTNVFNGKQISVFVGVPAEHHGEPMKLTLFRVFALVIVCILPPGGVQGQTGALTEDGAEFEVCRQMSVEVLLKEDMSEIRWDFVGSRVEFNQHLIERGSELCLRLLNKQRASGISGYPGTDPGTTQRADYRPHDTKPSCDERVSHVLWAQAGGTIFGLVLMGAIGVLALRFKAT